MTYTPGPYHHDGLSIIADYTDNYGNRHHCHVADVTNRNDINRGPSNEELDTARLLAAAPELLAVLHECIAALMVAIDRLAINDMEGEEYEFIDDCSTSVELARAAIAKATN